MSKEYKVLIQGVKGLRKLIPISDSIYDHINGNVDRDWYESIFYYSQEHYDHLLKTKSLAGIEDVTTDKLVWDFDDEADVEHARSDSKILCSRLIEHGVNPDEISIAFSGRKGFSIILKTDKRFSVSEFRNINSALAAGLETNDSVIGDPQRVFRVLGTKHNKTDFYKYPLNLAQLTEMPVDEIKRLAIDLSSVDDSAVAIPTIALPDSVAKLKDAVLTTRPMVELADQKIDELDFKSKPRGFTNCKFAIMNGFFPGGMRNNSLMALAATCKAQGYPKEITYNMCKGAARLQGQRTDQEPYSKVQIWNEIIEPIYKPNWKGGQYSCKKEPWLHELCSSLGRYKCNQSTSEDGFVHVEDMHRAFEDYSVNIEKNTIRTGIEALDSNVQLTVGMPVALLGAPSSGKTSLSLNILNNTSLMDLSSAFFSMDMYGPLVYMKQIQKQYGLTPNQIYEIFKHDKKKATEINHVIKEQYKHVKFSLKAGHSVQEMRDIVSEHEQASGEEVKLVLIDYLECIAGPYSDATANTQKIAGELRDFATEMKKCVITLVQPPKSAGDASCELTSMRQIKGSSMLEQSFRVILGIYRDGFGPKYSQYDKFITINALKNTMGPLFSVDNRWEGLRGSILPMDDADHEDLAALRKMRKEDASADKENNLGF